MLHKQTHLYVHILYIKVEVAVIEEKRWLVGGGGGDGVSDGGGYNRLMFGTVQSISMQNNRYERTHGHNNNNNDNNFTRTHAHTHTPCPAGHYASIHTHSTHI